LSYEDTSTKKAKRHFPIILRFCQVCCSAPPKKGQSI